MKNDMTARRITALVRSAALCAVALGFGAMPVSAANLTRSIEVNGGLAAAGRYVHRRRQVAADSDARHQGRQGVIRGDADRAQ